MRMPVLLLLAAMLMQPQARAAEKLVILRGLDAYMPIPEDNPLTPEKVALGRELFFDKQLSRDRSLSCGTCHDPKRVFTDEKPVAVGVFKRKGNRRTPTLVNRGYGKIFFWDGRITGLEKQVVQPILAEKEMDLTLEEVIIRLNQAPRYRRWFQQVFHREIHSEDLGRALASYVRTILSGDSPYDRYIEGRRKALSKEARQGLRLFRGKAGCAPCHAGLNFSDEDFHNTGVAWRGGRLLDPGRYKVTEREKDLGAFKTPVLREVARRPPYMHDGSIETLEKVIEFYNDGGIRNPYLDREMRPLKLTEDEQQALLVFLRSLNGVIREGM